MKISIGTNIQDGPWGGGNLFAINLKKFLQDKNHDVVFNLKDKDIDIILLTEPRKTSPSSAFTNYDVLNYISYVNENAIVVHRINECDEHKDTNFINKYISYANQCADATIFVSTWIKALYENFSIIQNKPRKVILAGSDREIFNNSNIQSWDKKSKLKFVTHHWSNNWNKGFDVYKKFDELLEESEFRDKYEFNFIGRLPKKFSFRNTKLIDPKSGQALADELKKNNFYITGTLNEPSGNHHIEASQCGLPVMYIDSGGVKEYCNGFGLEYEIENLKEKILEATENYDTLFTNMKSYLRNSHSMCEEFLNFFEELIASKDELINKRKKIRKSIFKSYYYQYLQN